LRKSTRIADGAIKLAIKIIDGDTFLIEGGYSVRILGIDACQARNYYGKEVIVEGRVVANYLSKKNNLFLNFGNPYPNQCFSVVIFNFDLSKFGVGSEKYYDQKTVRIRGKIQEYQGRPEIILKEPLQIEVGKQ
jgi:hypothetical protein